MIRREKFKSIDGQTMGAVGYKIEFIQRNAH